MDNEQSVRAVWSAEIERWLCIRDDGFEQWLNAMDAPHEAGASRDAFQARLGVSFTVNDDGATEAFKTIPVAKPAALDEDTPASIDDNTEHVERIKPAAKSGKKAL